MFVWTTPFNHHWGTDSKTCKIVEATAAPDGEFDTLRTLIDVRLSHSLFPLTSHSFSHTDGRTVVRVFFWGVRPFLLCSYFHPQFRIFFSIVSSQHVTERLPSQHEYGSVCRPFTGDRPSSCLFNLKKQSKDNLPFCFSIFFLFCFVLKPTVHLFSGRKRLKNVKLK